MSQLFWTFCEVVFSATKQFAMFVCVCVCVFVCLCVSIVLNLSRGCFLHCKNNEQFSENLSIEHLQTFLDQHSISFFLLWIKWFFSWFFWEVTKCIFHLVCNCSIFLLLFQIKVYYLTGKVHLQIWKRFALFHEILRERENTPVVIISENDVDDTSDDDWIGEGVDSFDLSDFGGVDEEDDCGNDWVGRRREEVHRTMASLYFLLSVHLFAFYSGFTSLFSAFTSLYLCPQFFALWVCTPVRLQCSLCTMHSA